MRVFVEICECCKKELGIANVKKMMEDQWTTVQFVKTSVLDT